MTYSKEFIKKCKQAFPDCEKLNNELDSGSEQVGYYLYDSLSSGVPIDTILKANSLEEIKNEALRIKERGDLYREWMNTYCASLH